MMDKNILIAITVIMICMAILLPSFLPKEKSRNESEIQSPFSSAYTPVTINIPAVDENGNGVIAKLKVESMPGEGRILTNINQLFFWIDTQSSIRTAGNVAQNITGVDLSKTDLIYNIETNATAIEGNSAGAALTIATIALFKNKTLPTDVMITGTINTDGSIGPVGGVLEKAKASRDSGARLLLVPSGQDSEKNNIPQTSCRKIWPITFCQTEYQSYGLNISSESGIEIREVGNIRDALPYFIN